MFYFTIGLLPAMQWAFAISAAWWAIDRWVYDFSEQQWRNAQDDDGTVKDPLILDLDGDGIETTGITDIDTCFDHDKNGFAELTTWAAEDDGVLAVDVNSNGTIDDGSEILGDQYELSGGLASFNIINLHFANKSLTKVA